MQQIAILKPQERKRPQFSQEQKSAPMFAQTRTKIYSGNAGFSEIAYLDDGLPKLRQPKLETMMRVRPGEPQDDEDSEACLDREYVKWMKNLSMFHQLRERVEEGRAKDKLEDYKLQIVKGLMQKNQILEELENKVTQLEEGQDPQQAELLKKIEQLEIAIAKKKNGGSSSGANVENKMNQALDFMMYNMSVLQQMVNNVAQMQKSQMEHVQHTNKVIQSLPQIIAHLNYQTRLEDRQNQQLGQRRPDSRESAMKRKDRKVTVVSNSQVGKKSPKQSVRSDDLAQSDVEATIKQKMQSSRMSSNQPSKKDPLLNRRGQPVAGQRLPPIDPDRNLISQSAQAVDSNQFRASALKSRDKLAGGGSGTLSPSGKQSAVRPTPSGQGPANKQPDGSRSVQPAVAPGLGEPPAPGVKKPRRKRPEEDDDGVQSQKFGTIGSQFGYTEGDTPPIGAIPEPPDNGRDESMVQSEGGMRGGRDKTGNNTTLNNGRNASRRYSRYSDTQLGKDQSSILRPGREDEVSKLIAERMKKKRDTSPQGLNDNSKGSKSDKLPQGLILTPILNNPEEVPAKLQAQ